MRRKCNLTALNSRQSSIRHGAVAASVAAIDLEVLRIKNFR